MRARASFALMFLAGIAGGSCAADSTSTFDPTGMMNVDMGMSMDMSGTGCMAAQTYSATQSPAAMLVVLDKSSSMSQGNKWQSAGQAIVQVFDYDVFNSMSLGLLAAPSGQTAAPQCLIDATLGIVTQVSCLAPTFPQVDLAPAGAEKANAPSGVRHDVKSWLASNGPDTGLGDASPLYSAIQTGISTLKGWSASGKRIMMVVTDGSIDCCSVANPPRSGYADANTCNDWEDPNNIIGLLKSANQDPQQPIETFIIGVPGADTYDASAKNYPPYHMRLALSAMAYAGSPSYVPAGCTGKVFTKDGADPAVSCHFDLTQGSLNASTVAAAIAQVRGKVAGCTYDLPMPGGVTIDRSQVNVSYTVGTTQTDLTRRKDQTNPCTSTGCWDYTSDGKVQLIGKACSDVQTAPSVAVKVTVGCSTIIG